MIKRHSSRNRFLARGRELWIWSPRVKKEVTSALLKVRLVNYDQSKPKMTTKSNECVATATSGLDLVKSTTEATGWKASDLLSEFIKKDIFLTHPVLRNQLVCTLRFVSQLTLLYFSEYFVLCASRMHACIIQNTNKRLYGKTGLLAAC